MNHSSKAIEKQLRLGEDSEWEFKEVVFSEDKPTSPVRNDWADEIAAFANATGGTLLASVSDDGGVKQMSHPQIRNLDDMLTKVCSESIKPPGRIRRYHRELPDGNLVLLAEVAQGDVAHESPGGRYIRVGASKRLMEEEEWVRLVQWRARAHSCWFDQQTVPDTGFATLEKSLWKPLLSAESAGNPEEALRNLALLADDEAGILRATVVGILLCTLNPKEFLPHAVITATRYRGDDRTSDEIEHQEITGPLPEQIAETVKFVVRNMRVSSRKEPARVDLPQYSEKAIFEAVVNAIVHRDYSMKGSGIRVSQFDNHLEIVSPGSLPNNLTVESMALQQSPRNEALKSVLARIPVGGIPGQGDLERRGSGVSIINRETTALCGKNPVYQVVDDAEVHLRIPAAPLEPSPARPVITVSSRGQPVAGANLLVQFPNKTWKQTSTNEQGEAAVDLHTTELTMTVFTAAPGYAANLTRQWIPSEGALAVDLHILPTGGSVIFPEANGQLPGLRGSLNPKRDSHDRTYLYARNIAIDDGKQQPVNFFPGDQLHLTDADGAERRVRIIAVEGRSALLEYDAPCRGDGTEEPADDGPDASAQSED